MSQLTIEEGKSKSAYCKEWLKANPKGTYGGFKNECPNIVTKLGVTPGTFSVAKASLKKNKAKRKEQISSRVITPSVRKDTTNACDVLRAAGEFVEKAGGLASAVSILDALK